MVTRSLSAGKLGFSFFVVPALAALVAYDAFRREKFHAAKQSMRIVRQAHNADLLRGLLPGDELPNWVGSQRGRAPPARVRVRERDAVAATQVSFLKHERVDWINGACAPRARWVAVTVRSSAKRERHCCAQEPSMPSGCTRRRPWKTRSARYGIERFRGGAIPAPGRAQNVQPILDQNRPAFLTKLVCALRAGLTALMRRAEQ